MFYKNNFYDDKPAPQRYKSFAEWPNGTISEDEHRSKGLARAICRVLEIEGMGGEGKIFPVRTWVEPIEE